jgi:hypothetical protein
MSSPPSASSGSNPFVFRFYAAVAKGRKSKLYFVPPSPQEGTRQHRSKVSFNAPAFTEMLGQLMLEVNAWFPTKRYLIIMDHAKQHTAKCTRLYVESNSIKVHSSFPPQSWDINIIENCWGLLNNNLRGSVAKTADGWRAAIKQAWDAVQIRSIDELIKGVKSRLQAIIKAKGQWVKHH